MSKSPGPIVLAVALLLLAFVAAWLAYEYPDAIQEVHSIVTTPPSGKPTVKLKDDELAAKLAPWNSPVVWKEPENKHPLFDSETYLFYPAIFNGGNGGNYIQKDDGTARSNRGVLLSWYRSHNIDITTPDIDRDDPDNDGFSNWTEFKNEQVGERLNAADCDGSKSTNPMDPKSHPAYLARLRLKQYTKRSFHILFNGYQELNGVYEFQIFLRDVSSDKQPGLKKTGEPLGQEGYTVGEFHLNIVKKMDPQTHVIEDVDESTLDLVKPEIGLTTTLPYRAVIDSPESTADFVMLMPSEVDKVMKVSRGKILTIPYISETTYRVIEANDDGAKIRDMNTQKEYMILKLIPSDWDEVPVPPTTTPKNP